MYLLRKSLFLLLIIYLDIMETHSERILAVFPFNAKSHHNVFNAFLRSLAKKGHQVDVITHYPLKNPPKNYRTIVNLHGTRTDYVNNVSMEFISGQTGSPVSFFATVAGNEICNLLSLKKMQNVIKNPSNEPPYDLVITQVLGANCYIGLGYVFKVPVITVATNLESPWTGDGVGSPTATAYYTDAFTARYRVSTFWERLENTLHSHINKYRYFTYTEKAQTEAMRKYLSPDIPSVREIERTVALTFVNSYYNPFGIKPSTPGLIEIGGIHIEDDDSKLTPDLERWMNESTNGVIYFTFGTMMRIETLPEETLLAFYKSFEKIAPMRVLMKIADNSKLLPGLPENVLTFLWIPQIPVLKHHNTRLFITHGGMLGIQEALYYKVPMIGIPLASDQFRNVETLVNKNICIRLNYNKITLRALNEALNAIINDPKYRKSAERESQLFRDRPMSPTDTATFWVEYVMRNGGDSLRSPAVNLYWWEVALLDVYGFILFSCITLIYLIILTSKVIVGRCFKTFTISSQITKKIDCLVKKGHHVDVITHYPLKDPPKNYRTIINLNGTRVDYVNNVSMEQPLEVIKDPVSYYVFGAGNEICNLLSLTEIQNIIKNRSDELPYDLVITQVLTANCYIGLGYVFKVPVITVATNVEFPWTGDGVGSPTASAYYKDALTRTYTVSTFWERLQNTWHSHSTKYRYFIYTEKAQTESMRKYLSSDIPSVREIERTVALTLVNSYHNPFGIKPSTPGLIEIGGIHIEEDDTKLTPELERWMNESTNGVIYFTFGSMILVETLPEETLLAFYKSFEKIAPMRVLMKIADKTKLLPGLPDNVRTSSWIPQIPVLKHHNTRLFITHGGMLGIQEALYHKVPMIGIPLLCDQFRNVETLVNKNIGIRLDYNKITLQTLDEAFNAILNDPKYRKAVERESQLFRDRPMSPMDTACFWVEYVLRNGGDSLRSPAVNLYWWEVALLDVCGLFAPKSSYE
ncbi:UDP-glucuronosyltransferase 2B15-like [Belonocnema kinseyi]|uniref:UDP-glucuronosyltransferase 2B15-like n=1 Tax=Belonocnema kinseyi TaxID=2817044 RepID=UPI00143D1EEF|nr:UDP-glucuronosyltransferase 2B15-like [Belonocnema kinseyi]